MTKKQLWVSSANHDEESSFCDTASQNHYQNVGSFEKEKQVRDAIDRGDEPIVTDDPANADDTYGVNQRFNLLHTEEDSQGSHTPAKHRVGGQ